MRYLLASLLSFLLIAGMSQTYIPGYETKIAGEDLEYHSPQPDATVSLLVRSEDSSRYIEWESAVLTETETWKVSKDFPGLTFLFLAGIDVNAGDAHQWKVYVNGKPFFTISSPTDTLNKNLVWRGPDGSSLVFKTKEVDKYGDFMGYLFCTLPNSMLEAGKPVRFKVVGESAGSRTWFMVFKYKAVDTVRLVQGKDVMRGDKGNYQVLRAEIVRYAGPVEARITVAGQKLVKHLDFGYNVLYLPVPQINADTEFTLVANAGKALIADQSFRISPVTPRTVYLLHHSHNDIGYTDIQTDVEKKQWENLESAIRIADESKDLPPACRMKWCTEVMWAVESWYDKASPEEKVKFRQAVKAGSIELNGLFANELTGLCGPEELDRLLEAGRRISRECGVNLTSAMITDIPGWSWAIVPAMAKSGVKYFSIGTNRGDRIGTILKVWGDKPFYWVSPSGEDSVLCWIHGEGYSLFHTGLAYTSIRKRLQEDLIFSYLAKLAETNYPWEEVTLRYNIGSDNGPIDPTLPLAVKEWNEKYVTPQIAVSTVEKAFSEFERKHGKELPRVSGDLTGYWEDGAYSTAHETAINRANASRLTQSQALWAMYNPTGYPADRINEAWRNVLLFDEHTWGSWNSVSEPDAPFTLQQWEIKKSFVLKADKQSKKLLSDAMISPVLGGPAMNTIEVINTCSWQRSGLVTLPKGSTVNEITLTDKEGKEITTQIMSDGTLAFIAKDIPALASRTYTISNKSPNRSIAKSPNFLLRIDSLSGSISSIILKSTGEELVDTSVYRGINEYLYVDGRLPDHPLSSKIIKMEIPDDGPVIKTIRIFIDSPGCKSLVTDIRIIDELNYIEITNTIDKKKVISPEAVHIAFPFKLTGGTMRYDLAEGYCQPQIDQLPGSNKNYLALEHWLDISNDKTGVTVICPDAPLFEAGKISMDEKFYGWVDSIPPTQTFFSYLMNNYWETNYAASQEGTGAYRYIIKPHDSFNPAEAEKQAIGLRQPLIARTGGNWLNEKPSLISIENDNLIIYSINPLNKGQQLLIFLYNAGDKEEILTLKTAFKEIFLSDPDGQNEEEYPEKLVIPSNGTRYLRILK